MKHQIEVILPSKRRLELRTFHIFPVNPTDLILHHDYQEIVARTCGTDAPVVLSKKLEYGMHWFCICTFLSQVMVPAEEMGFSVLVVCWYTDNVDRPVRQLVCEGVTNVDWESNAKDFYSAW